MRKIITFIFLLFTLLVVSQNAYNDKGKCSIIARSFVEKNIKYPKESSFNSSTVHSTDGYGKAIVLGKFTAKNGFGVKSEYGYKIWLEHNGRDWSDVSNWKYSKLIIEDAVTGKQQVIDNRVKPKNDTRENNLKSINGVSCIVFEKNSNFTKIKTSKKLTKAQMQKIIDMNNITTNLVIFHSFNKLKRGEEYASKIGKDWFIY